MANDFGAQEAEAICPVSLDVLGQLHRLDPAEALDGLRHLSDDQRARLALFCYGRAHFRDLALTIAASCDADRLGQLAGTMGTVLASQSRNRAGKFGAKATGLTGHRKPKVSLADGMRR